MKVLQLCKYYPPILGGIELVEKTITKAHADLGDQVFIAAFGNQDQFSEGEFQEKIYLIKEDLFFKSAPMSFKFIFQLKSLLKKHSINRIYVHLPNPYMHEVVRFSKNFFKKNKIEVVAVYHSDVVNQKILGTVYNRYFSATNSFYDLWICSSRKLWNSSSILKKLPELKLRVVPFCTDSVMTYRSRDKFNGKLLAVGRLVPYKGFEFLIEAINKTKYELNIIGDGPEYKKLESIAGKNIILHRHLNDQQKKNLFDQCDALVVSSINRAEAYGMIIVEAFEAGLPVIASDIDSGVTFLVQNEKTGLVFEIKNEDQLIKSIERFENSPELYSQISKNTKAFFDSELSYEHFRERIAKL